MNMLIAHILIALLSLGSTAITFFLPSSLKLRISQILIASTLLSGTYLVFSMNVNLLHVCAMGLVYTAIAAYGLAAARNKLALETS